MTSRQFLEDRFGRPLAALMNTSVTVSLTGYVTEAATFLGLVRPSNSSSSDFTFDAVVHLHTDKDGDLRIVHLTRLSPLSGVVKKDSKEDSRLTEKITIEEKLP